jgi:hypothetical protein
MKINVTREDIRNGKPGKPTECMVALALKRELGISMPASATGKQKSELMANTRSSIYQRELRRRSGFGTDSTSYFRSALNLCPRVS